MHQLVGEPDVIHELGAGSAAATRRRHPHAQGVGALRHLRADAAQAYDEHRLAVQLPELLLGHGAAVPPSASLLRDESIQAARKGEHHRHDMLGDLGTVDPLGVGDENIAFFDRRDANAVLGPGGRQLNPLQHRSRLQNLGGAEPDDGVGLGNRSKGGIEVGRSDELHAGRCRL